MNNRTTEMVRVKIEYCVDKNVVGLQSLVSETLIPSNFDYVSDAIDVFMQGLGKQAYLFETRSSDFDADDPYSELKQRIKSGISRRFTGSISTKYCMVFDTTFVAGCNRVTLKVSMKYA